MINTSGEEQRWTRRATLSLPKMNAMNKWWRQWTLSQRNKSTSWNPLSLLVYFFCFNFLFTHLFLFFLWRLFFLTKMKFLYFLFYFDKSFKSMIFFSIERDNFPPKISLSFYIYWL
jgi:hypothetical protein